MSLRAGTGLISTALLAVLAFPAVADPLPPDTTYRPLPTLPFSAVKQNDEAQKPAVKER